jgi:hypothetical protein
MTETRSLFEVVRERFAGDTKSHELTVLRDDGLYRHLRFQKPGTSIYRFDIVTWPGYLAFVGDAGDFVFARTADMLEFFVPKGREGREAINPQYWSEKLVAPKHDAAETYSYQVFCQRVQEWFKDVSLDLTPAGQADLGDAVNEHLLSPYLDAVHSEHDAHVLLRDFECQGTRVYDSWEWNLREYRHDFLWCCYALVWGIARYRAAVSQAEAVGV